MKLPDSKPKQAGLLALVSIGMFGFACALAPLYEVFCEITGLNGRTSGEQASVSDVIEVSDREVTIQFTAHVSRGMPWEFRPSSATFATTGRTIPTRSIV